MFFWRKLDFFSLSMIRCVYQQNSRASTLLLCPMERDIFVPRTLRKKFDDELTIEFSGEEAQLIAQMRLSRDLKKAASELKDKEARYLVDRYYSIQRDRIGAAAQIRAAKEDGEPSTLTQWVFMLYAQLEADMKHALGEYAEQHTVGRWSLSQVGIGPVLAAGLLANIPLATTPGMGNLWSFAGLDPESRWLGKEGAIKLFKEMFGEYRGEITEEMFAAIAQAAHRNLEGLRKMAKGDEGEEKPITKADLLSALAKRPWNASLKRLAWLIGQSIMKTQNNENSFYGPLFKQRKQYEQERNVNGVLSDYARLQLERKNYGLETEARKWYEGTHPLANGIPMLPPAHIEARAERWIAKLFLGHWWQVLFESSTNEPAPRPWILTVGGHEHVIPPPNWPIQEY